jgi:geranylgeranyl reductase
MISPANREVDMPVGNGFVGMVDRDMFDEWLRERAADVGAIRRIGTFDKIERDAHGNAIVHYFEGPERDKANPIRVRARSIIGADGARSAVARQEIRGAEKMKYVFAYHEIVRAPAEAAPGYDPSRCDVFYQGHGSPDFYSWIFPHGDTMSIGTGSMQKGFSLRGSVARLRKATGLDNVETIRREGAPIPLKPLKKWDNGRDVVVAGDAAGVVAPASGEGIYYAMTGGQLAAEAVELLLTTGKAASLKTARKRFMKDHGKVFLVLGIMQYFWYANDKRRERFVKICMDKDVQALTWDAYMNKKLVRAKPKEHVKIFLKDMAHLLGFAAT